ncbi:uncharacterized protein [Triticum aestivum]|uniref:uncharacterized protein isoform X1 n=1 Tax=Triticum aestivum TaxID=4565 RepID=UPI001D008117|nr:uncharacterized protein LOC123136965 isoform X1 [Triticum aestivum]
MLLLCFDAKKILSLLHLRTVHVYVCEGVLVYLFFSCRSNVRKHITDWRVWNSSKVVFQYLKTLSSNVATFQLKRGLQWSHLTHLKLTHAKDNHLVVVTKNQSHLGNLMVMIKKQRHLDHLMVMVVMTSRGIIMMVKKTTRMIMIATPYQVKLVLIGPSRAMSAYADGWLIEVDVPPESSLLPENHATKKIAGGVFKMSLDLDDDFLDKPRTSIIFARGGFVHFTYVVFNNAVKASVTFMLHARCQDNLQFVCHCKVQGELTLHVGNLPIGCTVFINQVEDEAVYFMPCESFRENCLGLKLPLTRNVLALPIGSLVCAKGTLMVGNDMSMVVDQSFVLEGYTSQTQWQVDQSFDATICIVSSSLFMEW